MWRVMCEHGTSGRSEFGRVPLLCQRGLSAEEAVQRAYMGGVRAEACSLQGAWRKASAWAKEEADRMVVVWIALSNGGLRGGRDSSTRIYFSLREGLGHNMLHNHSRY